ncbi:hypothetical protein ERJ75_001402200 [Trypanosoma vivax]|uniref:Uncharacterized protein n=1 Tax=Trypanosoma vivax (strain Y486) TaxID=1055687 RepID=F9WRF6_TRYVY|nr:hypothetical protein TRVL_06598 [Trypanosoma vivax]KAH8607509.1 hypothetical protein ERJ75_001402200 [Trypanosoma vivax]CCD20140.1 hypothetical protein, conserved [Trypanosoma vivax Y486]|eukprot:CCD20140.1 hypothetical protein, conserved [Trypanosoma vivax Y486]
MSTSASAFPTVPFAAAPHSPPLIRKSSAGGNPHFSPGRDTVSGARACSTVGAQPQSADATPSRHRSSDRWEFEQQKARAVSCSRTTAEPIPLGKHGDLLPLKKEKGTEVLIAAPVPPLHRNVARNIPLHEQPSYRADLLRRSVFVFGLRSAKECGELIKLLGRHCGPIAGAFRTADHMVVASAARGGANGKEDGDTVVVCVVFHSVESANAARRLDSTAQIHQNRFLVESAARFHCDSFLSKQQGSTRQLGGNERAGHSSWEELPQHYRLWKLLFSPVYSSVYIDWAAAGAAVQRGEALALEPTTLSVLTSSERTRTGGGGGVKSFSSMPRANDSRNGVEAMANDGTTLSGPQCPSAFGVTSSNHGSHLPTSVIMQPSQTYASLPAVELDELGHSNTLQQQYYSELYETGNGTFGSTLLKLASSVLTTMFGGGSDGGSNPRGDVINLCDTAPSEPALHRLSTPAVTEDITTTKVRGGVIGVTGGPNTAGHTETSGNCTNNNVYIPRVHGISAHIVAALPFVSSLVSPLLRSDPSSQEVGTDMANQMKSGRCEENTSDNEPVWVCRKRRRCAGDVMYERARLHSTGADVVRSQREEGESLCGLGGGLTTTDPSVLASRFVSSTLTPRYTSAVDDASVADQSSWFSLAAGDEYEKRGNDTDVKVSDGGKITHLSSEASFLVPNAVASNSDVRTYVVERVRLRPVS